MSNEVKRYDPINSDGTCGMCIEDADYGAYVEYADYAALEAELATVKKVAYGNMELLDENQKLKAELAKLHAGQESLLLNLADQKRQADEYRAMWAKAVASSPQPSAVPDAIATAIREFEKSGWHGSKGYHAGLLKAASIAEEYAAPSSPATVPSVNQQLLEALDGLVSWAYRNNQWECTPMAIVRSAYAIAAARKGEV